MVRAFTVLNHGTCSHRNRTDGEIVADFGRNMMGTEYKEYLITDGPGAEIGQLMPGKFDPYTKSKIEKNKSPEWSKTRGLSTIKNIMEQPHKGTFTGKMKAPKVKYYSKVLVDSGAATGHGWDDNIRHAIATLANVICGETGAEASIAQQVNMIGWSRGAVTCLRMANWIKEFLGRGVKVNIFAIDPVAGRDAGLKLTDTQIVDTNVDNYIGILALDETRKNFRPQDLNRIQIKNPMHTNLAFLPFPGIHDTVVMKEKDRRYPEVAQIVRYLGWKFLSKHDTGFIRNSEFAMSRAAINEKYAQIIQKRDGYATQMDQSGFGNYFIAGGYAARKAKGELLGKYVYVNDDFFLNEHHRACFKKDFPDIYDYFFTHNLPKDIARGGEIDSTHTFFRKFENLSSNAKASFSNLHALFGVTKGASASRGRGTTWKVPEPGIGPRRT